MKAIGLDFLDGQCCIVGDGMTIYSGNSFGLTFGINWLDDNYFVSFRDMEALPTVFPILRGTERLWMNILKAIPHWKSTQ